MEEISKIEKLAGDAKAYIQVRIAQVRLTLAEKTAGVISQLIADSAVILIFVIALLFAGVACALFLGRWFDNMALGFLLVSGLFIIAGIIASMLKQLILRAPAMNRIIQQLLNNEDSHEED